MNVLFLDDDKQRTAHFLDRMLGKVSEITCVETPEEAIHALNTQKFDFVSLDHDLHGKVYQPSDENSGYWVAKHIAGMDERPASIVCHTWNESGAEAMKEALDGLAVIAPFDSQAYWRFVLPN